MDLKWAFANVMSRPDMRPKSATREDANVRGQRDRAKDFPPADPVAAISDRRPVLQAESENRAEDTREPSGTRATERSSIGAMLEEASRRRQRFAPELRNLDLNPVRYQLRRQYHWPLDRILRAEDEFLEFLAAIQRNPELPLVPTVEADLFWHSLLLIGPLYMSICERVFGGRILLHDPFHKFVRGSAASS